MAERSARGHPDRLHGGAGVLTLFSYSNVGFMEKYRTSYQIVVCLNRSKGLVAENVRSIR